MAESSYFTDVYGNQTYDNWDQDIIHFYWQYQAIIWTIVMTSPIVAALCLPHVMIAFVYSTALYLKAYRYYYKIKGYTFTPDFWNLPKKLIAYLYNFQGRFWYGYEVKGLNNIPREGPALIVFYHGVIPVDWFYLLAKTFIYKNRLISFVGDRSLFRVPGFDAMIECLQIIPGSVDTCADILKEGNLLAIAPGGAREAFFADESYPLIWGSRIGFAKVAIEAKVPIIPVFTENIREAFFTISLGRNWLRGIYEKTRIPLFFPLFGGFPTKLKTIVGKPIKFDPSITPHELAAKVAEEMKLLIKNHQKLPGSVTRSVMERLKHLFKFKQS